jgi:hypothetical protein
VGNDMRLRNSGRILIVGSLPGSLPAAFKPFTTEPRPFSIHSPLRCARS